MKKILYILLLCVSVNANDLFLYDFTGSSELSEVINNKMNTLETIVGKTYSLKNNLSLITSTNGTSSYIFAHRIAFNQKESTGVYFTHDDIKYKNEFKLPEVVKVEESLFAPSVNGEVYVISEHDKQNMIGTSMANILFNRAKLFIKSADKYTHVYVQEGKCTVQDSKSSKKKKELKEGDYLVVTPQIFISAKDARVSTGNSFSSKEIEEEEKNFHKQELESLKNKLDNTLFVGYNDSVLGVKLK